MKQIDAFVDSIYQNVGGNKREIRELKSEMKSHLLEAIFELKSEGKSEEEAIKIAIERFGGEKEIRTMVEQIFKVQKVFAKWVLYVAIIFLVVSSLTFGYFLQQSRAQAFQQSEIADQIANILKDKTVITQEMKTNIKQLVNSTNYISDVRIYKPNEINGNSLEPQSAPTYHYQRKIWAPIFLYHIYPYGNGDKQWFVYLDTKVLSILIFFVFIAGLSVYWTLFSIWAIVNAYHQRRLKTEWIFAFIIFNILGYLIYLLSGKRKTV